jgi:hypothetical protein
MVPGDQKLQILAFQRRPWTNVFKMRQRRNEKFMPSLILVPPLVVTNFIKMSHRDWFVKHSSSVCVAQPNLGEFV